MITESKIVALLNTNPKAVERAMVVLYDRQTRDEKQTSTTKHHNNVGFSATTDKRGSYYARWVLSGRTLTGNHLEKARKIAIHHRGQLLDEAKKKLSKHEELHKKFQELPKPTMLLNVPLTVRCNDCGVLKCPDGCCCGC